MIIIPIILCYISYCLVQLFVSRENIPYLKTTYEELKNLEQKDVKKFATQVWKHDVSIVIFSDYVVKLNTKKSGLDCYTHNFYDIFTWYWFYKFRKLIISKPFLNPNVKE